MNFIFAALLIAQLCPPPAVCVTPSPVPTPTATPTPKPTVTPVPTPTPTPTPLPSLKPTAKNTGVIHPELLKKSGSVTASKVGQIVENLDISGTLRIGADNVIVRNVKITSNSYYGIQVTSGKNITVQDVEITNSKSAGIYGGNLRVTRAYIHDMGADGIKFTGIGSVLESSYVTRLGMSAGSHADAIQIEDNDLTSGGHSMIGNNFDMPVSQTGFSANRALMCYGNGKAMIIKNNWLNGGNYTLSAPKGSTITGNKFGRDFRYGIMTNAANATWANNTWEDTGKEACYTSNGACPK